VLLELKGDVKDMKEIEKDRNYAKEKGQESSLHRLRRQEEYLDTLRKNLRDPNVKGVHLLLEKESDLGFILDQGLPSDGCSKLRPVPLGRWMSYRDAFKYALEELPGELCMIMNADIFLSEGFHLATPSLFQREDHSHKGKVTHTKGPNAVQNSLDQVYVIARWEAPSVYCIEKKAEGCEKRARAGSYDAFLFRSPLPLSEDDLASIDFQQNIWGAENAVVGLLKKKSDAPPGLLFLLLLTCFLNFEHTREHHPEQSVLNT